MKTSMKLMVMTLVVAMLLSMSAFAASVSYTSLVPTVNEAGTDYSVVVNYAAADYATGDQITMLVLKDSAEITWVEGSNDTIPANVIYIDQETIEGATGSFTFTIAKSEVDGRNVYVKLGATSQPKANEGTYEDFVGGGNTGDVVLDSTNATVSAPITGDNLGAAVGSIYTVAITDATLAGKVPQAYVGDAAVGTVLLSTQRNKYIVVIPTANAADTITIKAVDATAATVTEFTYGDANGTGTMDTNDITALTLRLTGKRDLVNTTAKIVAADVDNNGKINSNDVTAIRLDLTGKRALAILSK